MSTPGVDGGGDADDADPRTPRASSPLETARRIAPFAVDGRRTFVALAASSAVGGVLEAAVLVVVTRVAVGLSEAGTSVELPLLGTWSRRDALVLAAALLLVKVLVQLVAAHQAATVATRSLTAARRALTRAFLAASWERRSSRRVGALQELLTVHVDRVASILLVAATGLVAATNVVALVAVAVAVDPVAAVAIVVTGTVLALVMRPLTRRIRHHAERHVTTGSTYASSIGEAVALSRDIQLFDVGDAVATRLDRLSDASAEPYRRSRMLGAFAPNLYQTLALAIVLLALALVSPDDATDVATLGAVVLLLLRALAFSQQAQTAYHSASTLTPYLDDLRTVLDADRAAARPTGGREVERLGTIRLDHVGFRYDQDHDALHDVSLTLAPGEAVGVVGPSGSGKSTLVALLLRLRSPSTGALLVEDLHAGDVALASWYQRVSAVAQDPLLVAGTVAENIDLWRGFDRAAVEQAAERAHVAEEIRALPDGFDTLVGGVGRGLSGGQRQRVCLARALLGEPDLLVLDEPTSALDPPSEAAVTRSLADLRGRTTVVIVAHRLSTLAGCDRIVVLEGGGISAVGTHAELVEGSDFYREAVRLGEIER